MKNKKLIIEIVIVVVIALGLGIGYYYFDNNQNNKKSEITRKEAKTYLSRVPFYGVDVPSKDAYQNKLVTIEDVDSAALLSEVSERLNNEQVYQTGNGVVDPGEDGDDVAEEATAENSNTTNDSSRSDSFTEWPVYLKDKDLKEMVKKYYNYDIKNMKDFFSRGSDKLLQSRSNLYFRDVNFKYDTSTGYFFAGREVDLTSGNISSSVGEMTKYEVKNGDLIIYEKFGVLNCKGTICQIYKGNELKEENSIAYFDESKTGVTWGEETTNKLMTYKHIFKKVDGKYYWYSSQPLK